MLYYFITAAWLTKVFIHPSSPQSVEEFYRRLAVGDLIPSWFVVLSAGAFVLGSTVLAVSSPSEETVERRTIIPVVAIRCGSHPPTSPSETRRRRESMHTPTYTIDYMGRLLM